MVTMEGSEPMTQYCPKCGLAIGATHLCPMITTAEGILVGDHRREVIDLIRSLDAVTKRIAELEGEVTRWRKEREQDSQLWAEMKASYKRQVRELRMALELAAMRLTEWWAFEGISPDTIVASLLEQARKELADDGATDQ